MRQQVIWKYVVELTGEPQTYEIPIPARVVHFDITPQGNLGIWVLIEEGAPLSSETFQIFGTGHLAPAADEASYVGTAIQGQYVWHLFKLMS